MWYFSCDTTAARLRARRVDLGGSDSKTVAAAFTTINVEIGSFEGF